jgi:uncharacterized protein (DUF2267 family)
MHIREMDGFDSTIQKTWGWIQEVQKELEWQSSRKTYRALRATLHALRDRLPVAEAVQLGAELPMLVRGFYYEGWTVSRKPVKERRKEQFLEHIQKEMGSDYVDCEAVVVAVFKVVASRISSGELEDIKHVMPKQLRGLWP